MRATVLAKRRPVRNGAFMKKGSLVGKGSYEKRGFLKTGLCREGELNREERLQGVIEERAHYGRESRRCCSDGLVITKVISEEN